MSSKKAEAHMAQIGLQKSFVKKGEHIGRNKCAKYMEDMNLHSCHKRHKTKSLTNNKRARGDGYPNILLYYEFPISPRKGLTRTGEGFMYHCIIKDIVSGEILGDHMAERMTKELVIKSILSVLARYRLENGCIFHSDRCSQYTSKAVMELLKQYGLRQSFSRVGMPGDNAWSESFFATMKKELIHWAPYRTKESVRAAVFEYIYCFYNVRRIQKRLGYVSSDQYFRSFKSNRLAEVA